MKFRKMFLSAVALTAAFGMAACGGATGGSVSKPVFESKEDVYGMSAMTTVSLLNSEFAAPALNRLAAAVAAADAAEEGIDADGSTETPKLPEEDQGGSTETPNLAEEDQGGSTGTPEGGEETPSDPLDGQLELFHKYFNMLDALTGSGIETSVVENADEAYAQYAFKMTIGGADFAGNAVTHVMYYNETGSETETDGDETETETTLEGVMLMFDREYRMEGERKAESEKDEAEIGVEIRAYLDETNRDDYVEVAQETETETGESETEYVYRVYRGGECAEETAVKFESEENNGKTETEIELEFRNADAAGKYQLDKEIKEDKTKIKVSYETVVAGEKVKGVFHLTEKVDEEGNRFYHYEFENGWTQDLEKDDD